MVSTKYDHVLIFLYRYDKINSHYPKKLLIEIMNHYFDYFYRKQLKVNAPIARNEMDVKYYFYQLCDALDKLSK